MAVCQETTLDHDHVHRMQISVQTVNSANGQHRGGSFLCWFTKQVIQRTQRQIPTEFHLNRTVDCDGSGSRWFRNSHQIHDSPPGSRDWNLSVKWKEHTVEPAAGQDFSVTDWSYGQGRCRCCPCLRLCKGRFLQSEDIVSVTGSVGTRIAPTSLRKQWTEIA